MTFCFKALNLKEIPEYRSPLSPLQNVQHTSKECQVLASRRFGKTTKKEFRQFWVAKDGHVRWKMPVAFHREN